MQRPDLWICFKFLNNNKYNFKDLKDILFKEPSLFCKSVNLFKGLKPTKFKLFSVFVIFPQCSPQWRSNVLGGCQWLQLPCSSAACAPVLLRWLRLSPECSVSGGLYAPPNSQSHVQSKQPTWCSMTKRVEISLFVCLSKGAESWGLHRKTERAGWENESVCVQEVKALPRI